MDGFDPVNLLQIPVFFFSLTLHEFAHAWTAKKGGDMTATYLGRLTLNPIAHIDIWGTIILPLVALFANLPMIGWAKPVPVSELRFRRSDWIVVVSLAGPASNMFLAGIAAILMKFFMVFGGPPLRQELYLTQMTGHPSTLAGILFLIGMWFIILNVLLAVFNLLPFPPLDGSKLIYQYYIKPRPHLYVTWIRFNQFGILFLFILINIPAFSNPFSAVIRTTMNTILSWIMST